MDSRTQSVSVCASMAPRLALDIQPRWEEIADVRRRTSAFLKDQQIARDVVDAVAMVACELTENATKYGAFRDGAAISVSVTVQPQAITVEVTNPITHTERENLNRLDRMIQWIRGFQDPFEAYLQRLKELSTEGLDSTESRLGLVRIAYEGQAVLDFYVNEHDVLAVSAIRRM